MQTEQYLAAYFGEDLPEPVVRAVAAGNGAEEVQRMIPPMKGEEASAVLERVAQAVQIRDLLARNTEEISSALRALNGEFILPEVAHMLTCRTAPLSDAIIPRCPSQHNHDHLVAETTAVGCKEKSVRYIFVDTPSTVGCVAICCGLQQLMKVF